MHICFLCNEYPPGMHGGVGTFTQTLGRELILRGHHVSVVGIYSQAKLTIEDDRGVVVHRIPASPIPKTGYFINGWRLRQVLQEIQQREPIDILDGPELSFSLVTKRFPAKKVIRMNGGHHFFAVTLGKSPKFWRSWLERQSFRKADHFCAVSQYAATTTQRLLKIPERFIAILPNPVDTKLFCPQTGIIEQENLIVFSGTICEKKGVKQLLEAFVQIAKVCPNSCLLMNGKDSIEPTAKISYIEYLRSRLPSHLLSRVLFNGHVPLTDLPKIYARGAILAFPSHMETQGIVTIEGMAMGKAVIASETGPGPEIIDNGENGLLCNPFDPNSIAEKINCALSDSNLRKKLGIAARRKVELEFSVDVLAKKNLAFYQQCLDNEKK